MTDQHDTFGDLEESFDNESSITEEKSDPSDSVPKQPPGTTSEDSTNRLNTVDEPAFAFSETDQQALYARSETWDILDDALFDAEGVLRKQNVRDVPKRELHDAALRVLADHAKEIAEQLINERQSGAKPK